MPIPFPIQGRLFTTRTHLARLAAALMFGLVVGVVSRVLRPYFPGPTHWETIGALAVLALAITGLMLSLIREPYVRAIGWLLGETIALWAAFGAGWSIVHGEIWGDLVAVVFFGAMLCAAIAAFLLCMIQLIWRPKVQFGPYCPGCRYHLMGVSEQRCPECGRAFTYDELGVRPEDLQVNEPSTTP